MAKMGTKTDFESTLSAVLVRTFGKEARLAGLKRLSGGASQETWALQSADQTRILRRAPGGVSGARSTAAIGLATEARLIEAAYAAGVPVPRIERILCERDGLGEGFIMQYMDGETIARKILRNPEFASARTQMARQCGAALAQIHAIDSTELPALPKQDGLAQIAQYEEIFRSFDVHRPVFELALQWLKAKAPPPLPQCLIHGDFRLGNLLVTSDGLTAILDWELAHLGDPREDIAWACINSWRFGIPDKRVGGFGDLTPLLEAYTLAGGVSISPEEIDWWEMLGSLKWGIMCMLMYQAFRSGADPNVERAAIGRRVSETEIDLLNLLEAAHA